MNRIRQGWDALRRGRRSGVSLVIALCAVAVFIGLSLSIVYSSSMLLSRANRKIGRERCYQLAQSFAQVLDSELTAYNTERTDLGGADDKWPQTADGSRTFYQYANSVLENLDAYDADDPEHTTYYYSAGDEDDDYGKVTVMLRKQNTDSEQNPADRTGCFPYAEKDRQTAEISAQTFIRYQLSVSVRVEKGADSFTYTTEYYRRDGFQPIYTWEGEGGSITPVYWVSQYFSRSHSIKDLLETVRSRVETATEYIKCYENGADITDRTGSSSGSAVEFGTSNAIELLTADGCAETAIMVGSRAAGTEAAVEKGYLLERYYDNSTGVFYSKNADGTPCARAGADLCKGLLHGSARRSVLRARRVRPHRDRHRDHLPRRGYDRRGLFGLARHRPAVRHPGQDRCHGAAASGSIKKEV